MPLTAEGSALVSGAAPAPKGAGKPTVKVRVLRAFLINAEPVPVGKVLDLDPMFARELHAYNKVELVKAKKE